MNYRIISCVGIALIIFGLYPLASAEAQIFEPKVDYLVSQSPESLAIADLNADGSQDLIIASNFYSSRISVLLGNGDGSFQAAMVINPGLQPHSAAVDDLNADGIADLIIVSYVADKVLVLLGNGDGTFQTAVQYWVGDSPHDVAIGDLDGDDIPDLAVPNIRDDSVSLLLGNGDGTFQAAANYWTMENAREIVMEDFDGDGNADLAVSSYMGQVKILLGNGDATFQNPINYWIAGGIYSVATDDLNGDGIPDLTTANSVSDCVSVLLGKGDGTFEQAMEYEVVGHTTSIAIGDLDGDGIPDLVTANRITVGTASVLLGSGDGTFLPPIHHVAGDYAFAVDVGDLNNDGSQDLAVVSLRDSTVSILINVREPGVTLFADLSCVPTSGTVPFDTRLSVSLLNRVADQSRRVAARIHVNLANGQLITNWKAGYRDIDGGSRAISSWYQKFPALQSLIGDNQFTLITQDVTPAPWNQPPFRASGYLAETNCTITAAMPYTMSPLTRNGYPQ